MSNDQNLQSVDPDQQMCKNSRRRERPKRRELYCPAHPEKQIERNGRKYFLHLLSIEELKQRGMSKTGQAGAHSYPVLVLSNEWLKDLFCPSCCTSRWFHITKLDKTEHTVR